MPSNIEIKVQLADLTTVRQRAAGIAESGPFMLRQVDCFFSVPRGRLKLRVETGHDSTGQHESARGELIAYRRADQAQARESDYSICPVGDTAALLDVLQRSLGDPDPVVRKTRELFLRGRSRIHLDQVEGLGDFVEIEVVMRPGENPDAGHQELQQIQQLLGIQGCAVQAVAYADLLAASRIAW